MRPLDEEDLNEWFRLRKLLWDAVSDENHKDEILDIIENTESQLVLVADTGDGRLAGFLEVSIRPFVEDCSLDNVGYLEGWFVDEPCRKSGIGRELVRHAEVWASRKGCTELASDAEIGNELSFAAHTNLGYHETSRLVHFCKHLHAV